MLKEAFQYLVSLKENKTYEIDGITYSDHDLHLIEAPVYRRSTMEFGSLDAIVKMVRTELTEINDLIGIPIFIHVEDHKNVSVFTRTDIQEKRLFPYKAVCNDTAFSEGWRKQQNAIIELRSRFIPTPDTEYLIGLISRINNESGIQSNDNGVSQTVTVRSGVSLMASETIKPRICLKPFRTFREVPQPESEFILRLDDDGSIGLFEADGGVWKMEAKDNIMAYFNDELSDEIEDGLVVVMV
jgi:hypothetical protein